MRLLCDLKCRFVALPATQWVARTADKVWTELGLSKVLNRIRAWHPPAILTLGMLSVLLTLQTLRFSAVDANWEVATEFLQTPLLFALNWLPIAALLYLWYCLLGRPYLAYLLTALPVLGLSLVNYYKLRLRGDPLLFADLQLTSEAKAMSARYSFALTPGVVFATLCVLLLAGALFFGYRNAQKPAVVTRLLGCAACMAVLFGYGALTLRDDALYDATGLSCSWMPTQSYVAHGVVYPFLRSVTATVETPPEGYDEAAAAAALAAYPASDIPDGQKVNIIAVMMEAFNDFSAFENVDFKTDPYADLHALMAQSYTGKLVVNVFAGETINTERAFLTGYLDPADNFRSPVNSFVWYLKQQGYRTQGSHPGYSWFYNRRNVDMYFGFDRYYFYEDRYQQFIKGGNILPDAEFMPTIFADYNLAKAAGKPLFSFHVTYQNHGPYATTPQYDAVYLPWKAGYNRADYNIANNYFTGIAETGRQLSALVERFRNEDEPIVLVLFGDHNPWWGDGNSTYKMVGINLDRTTQDGFYNYYCTPYLIWANDSAKAALGNDFVGNGGRIAPSFLMERLFTLAGWQGPAYMQALRALETHTTFVNRQYMLADGVLTGVDEKTEPAWLADFKKIEYYVKHSKTAETAVAQ